MTHRWHEETEGRFSGGKTHHLIPEGRETGIAWVHEMGTSITWDAFGGGWGVERNVDTAKVRAERAVGIRRVSTPPQGSRRIYQ